MIKIADLPVVRAQLERGVPAAKETQAQPAVTETASDRAAQRPRPDLVLDQGKYYVVDKAK